MKCFLCACDACEWNVQPLFFYLVTHSMFRSYLRTKVSFR